MFFRIAVNVILFTIGYFGGRILLMNEMSVLDKHHAFYMYQANKNCVEVLRQ